MDADADDLDSALRVLAVGPHATTIGQVTVPAGALDALVMRCYAEALDGQLFEAWRLGRLTLPAAQIDYVADHHRTVMAHALRVEQTALAVVEELTRRGIRTRVAKGMHLANTVYDDPSYRSFADADLLVEPGCFGAAIAAVEALGGRRVLPEVAPGHDELFAKEAAILIDGIPIDLHRTLIDGPYGVRVPVPGLFQRQHVVTIGAVAVEGLALVDAYLHAALTAGAGDDPARYVTLRDLLELESVLGDEVLQIAETAEASRLAAPVARAVVLVDRVLRPDVQPRLLRWAREHRPTRRERWILGSYLGAGRSYRRQLATVTALSGWRLRARFARNVVLPGGDYRTARQWSRGAHLARAIRRLSGH